MSKVRKPTLVSLVFDASIPFEEAQALTVNQIWDIAQKLPDEVWYTMSDKVMETDIPHAPLEYTIHTSQDQISETKSTRLATWADQHELLRETQDKEVMNISYGIPELNIAEKCRDCANRKSTII